jgi:poly(ADP-ribose) glycohydrolase
MDAIYFHDPSKQFEMANVERELLKAYTSFYPIGKGSNYDFAIATGNWGCGAFNGDKQLKGMNCSEQNWEIVLIKSLAIIQLMAASEVQRALVYAAYGDRELVNSFAQVCDYLRKEEATVGDLYRYLDLFCRRHDQCTLFEYILKKPVSELIL